MIQVTMQEWRVLTAVQQLQKLGGRATCWKVGKTCGMSRATVWYHLNKLEAIGVVRFCRNHKNLHEFLALNPVNVAVQP
jgi:predicted transcriptional regulator